MGWPAGPHLYGMSRTFQPVLKMWGGAADPHCMGQMQVGPKQVGSACIVTPV